MNTDRTNERFNVQQAAERLGVHPFTVRRLVRERAIAFYRPRPRGAIYFLESHLAEFERAHTFEPIGGEKEKAA